MPNAKAFVSAKVIALALALSATFYAIEVSYVRRMQRQGLPHLHSLRWTSSDRALR
jgi:hypothetical protein